MPRTLIVHYTHAIHPSTPRELARLHAELDGTYDIAVTGCCEHPTTLDALRHPQRRIVCSTRDDLRALPYPGRQQTAKWKTLRGNNDLALLHAFRHYPDYDHYWVIEYDVRYTGNWRHLFDLLSHSPADLLCTRIYRQSPQNPWPHWQSFSTGQDPPQTIGLISAFLPIHRASAGLLRLIDEVCRRGWTGHPEVLWPTAAAHHGLHLEEIGGAGPFTPPHRRRHYYRSIDCPTLQSSHTFTATPSLPDTADLAAHGPDTLWHPIKG